MKPVQINETQKINEDQSMQNINIAAREILKLQKNDNYSSTDLSNAMNVNMM